MVTRSMAVFSLGLLAPALLPGVARVESFFASLKSDWGHQSPDVLKQMLFSDGSTQ